MPNIDFPSTPTIGQQYTYAGVTYTFSKQSVWTPAFSTQAQTSSGPQGRLTLQSQNPVMISQTLGATGLIYTPYTGNKIPLFDGNDLVMWPFVETTGTTVDAVHNPSVIGPNKINDWFFWKDNSTTPAVGRLSHGPDWTDNLTRSAGTALVRMDGIWVNAQQIGNGTTTGPAAQRGTFVGTTASNAASMLDWKLGSQALGGGAATLNVWNTFNRKDTWTEVNDTTSSWVVPLSTFRGLNGSLNNRVTFVTGLAEDAMYVSIFEATSNVGGKDVIIGIALDQVLHFSGPTGWNENSNGALGVVNLFPAVLGLHFVQAAEYSVGAGGSILYGDESAAVPGGLFSQGLQFTIMM